MKEFVSKKDELNWSEVQSNIQMHKEEINQEIRKGLGKSVNSEEYDRIT